MSATGPAVNPVGYSPVSSTQRQRRLARVRLAELVAVRRAARSSTAPAPNRSTPATSASSPPSTPAE